MYRLPASFNGVRLQGSSSKCMVSGRRRLCGRARCSWLGWGLALGSITDMSRAGRESVCVSSHRYGHSERAIMSQSLIDARSVLV